MAIWQNHAPNVRQDQINRWRYEIAEALRTRSPQANQRIQEQELLKLATKLSRGAQNARNTAMKSKQNCVKNVEERSKGGGKKYIKGDYTEEEVKLLDRTRIAHNENEIAQAILTIMKKQIENQDGTDARKKQDRSGAKKYIYRVGQIAKAALNTCDNTFKNEFDIDRIAELAAKHSDDRQRVIKMAYEVTNATDSITQTKQAVDAATKAVQEAKAKDALEQIKDATDIMKTCEGKSRAYLSNLIAGKTHKKIQAEVENLMKAAMDSTQEAARLLGLDADTLKLYRKPRAFPYNTESWDLKSLVNVKQRMDNDEKFERLREQGWLGSWEIEDFVREIIEKKKPSGRKVSCDIDQIFRRNLKIRKEEKTKKELIALENDAELWGMNIGEQHWVLLVIKPKVKTVIYCDSHLAYRLAYAHEILGMARTYLRHTLEYYKNLEDLDNWTFEIYESRSNEPFPLQANNFDCGVFLCAAAARYIMDEPINFNQHDMLNYRYTMALRVIEREEEKRKAKLEKSRRQDSKKK